MAHFKLKLLDRHNVKYNTLIGEPIFQSLPTSLSKLLEEHCLISLQYPDILIEFHGALCKSSRCIEKMADDNYVSAIATFHVN